MKKILLTLTGFIVTLLSVAQSPNLMNYQGVARNAAGNVLPNQPVALRLSILNGSATGAAVYSETRNVTTNAFGLFNVVVGSPGAITTVGTIGGINWTAFGAGSGSKFLQVEIDPTGGTNFVNVGATQLVSVPYALNAGTSAPVGPAGGDLTGTYPNPTILIPFLRTQAVATNTMIGMTNSSTTGTLGALQGSSASTDANAVAIQGTISSTTPGGFSSGLRGVNNGTGGLGIGVYGSQNGSGWGVYGTTPGGIGVHGQSTSGFGVYGLSTSGVGVYGNSSTGRGGFFEVTNAASTSDAVRAETNGTGASWAVRAISSGTNGAGLFQQTNATNTANNLQSNQAGLGRAGLFNSTNAASTANAVDINIAGTGYALRAASTNAVPLALQTGGGLQHTGIGEALNYVLRTDAAGNATWVDPATLLPGANFWSRVGTNLFNTNLGDNVGVGTNAPAYKLDVLNGGSTGIRSRSSASFSVVDIDAFSGDAALRFIANGVSQWNMRNRPGDNYLEIFELGGGGSRMVIQDATGNVGIGQTVNPAYKLDVLHGGSTGLRVQSSASFSVVDIDAQSGDAALRFAKAGVNQWNIRNRPADDYLEIFELGGGGSRMVIQDATGNVGIGQTVNPAYKLDVLHGGSTGLRVQSSASFSVVDIDAQSGDAALRFVKAGVNQWNTRNRPADDYYEIFELGGGGSRMVIQDGTGNVGIGQTVSPAYRLDVQHGGATGIRSQSTASFSVVDIDAASGDAALRFQKAGVNQWNTRNNPATDDYQIFELGGGGERMRIENTTGNVVIAQDLNVVGTLSKGAGAFKIDHPLDPANKYLWHSFVESPDMMNIYNGNIVTDAAGKATVTLPDYFEALNMEFRYQLTVVGGTFAQAIISKEVSANKFEIATNQPNVKVSWQVTGIRHDAYAQKNRIPNTVEKEAKNKGKYLSPESFNQPRSKAIGYSAIEEVSSLKDVKPVPAKVARPENIAGTSLEDKAPAKATVKPVDNSGSVAPQVKKEEAKPIVKPTEKGSTEQ